MLYAVMLIHMLIGSCHTVENYVYRVNPHGNRPMSLSLPPSPLVLCPYNPTHERVTNPAIKDARSTFQYYIFVRIMGSFIEIYSFSFSSPLPSLFYRHLSVTPLLLSFFSYPSPFS